MTALLHSSLKDMLRALTVRFKEASLDTPDLDARILLMEATGLSRTDLAVNSQDVISHEAAKTLEDHARRRLSGEPIDSILGHREFYGRRFEVSKDVLSPRPETEGLVDIALARLKDVKTPHILDLGTGSGAILITLLLENTVARGLGTDVSPAALNVAKKNAKAHGLRSEWLKSDWYARVEGVFDMIVSNPPYITDAAMEALPVEVSDFDPDMALRGGIDGLEAYGKILAEAGDYLKPGGELIMEIGYDQGRAVPAMMQAAGLENIAVHTDLSGLDRIVSGTWPKK